MLTAGKYGVNKRPVHDGLVFTYFLERAIFAADVLYYFKGEQCLTANRSRPRTSNSMRVLGNGAMSTVFRAIDRRTGEPVAIKVCKKPEDDDKLAMLEMEVMIHAELRHPNVLGLLGNFERDDAVILVLEYAAIIQQTASALEYCHSKRIVHRDVKPANILVTGNGVVKLADFGISDKTKHAAEVYEIAGTSANKLRCEAL
ncbi:hypothetical protein COOONC_07007 [Cooperia oncophora]